MQKTFSADFSISYKKYTSELSLAQKEQRRPKISIKSIDLINDCQMAVYIYENIYSSLSLADRCAYYDTLKGMYNAIINNGDFSYFRSKAYSLEDNDTISEYAPQLKHIISIIHQERKSLRAHGILKGRFPIKRNNEKYRATPHTSSENPLNYQPEFSCAEND